MSETSKFFQVPLSVLAYGVTEAEKINAIIAHGTISAGNGRLKQVGADKVDSILSGMDLPKEFNPDNGDHVAWALGRDWVSWTWQQSPFPCITLYNKSRSIIRTLGEYPTVRISVDLVRQACEGKFEFRELSVLMAVFSIIGDKQYALVRRHRVCAGALGYRSARALFDVEGKLTPGGRDLLKLRSDNAQPLTLDKCRYTLDKLHERRFFSRVQPKKNGRSVYFSRSMTHDDLGSRLIQKLEQKLLNQSATEQRNAQDAFRAKADALLKRGISGQFPGIDIPSDSSTNCPRVVPALVPAGFPAPVPALIDASLIDAYPNGCSANACNTNALRSLCLEAGIEEEVAPAARTGESVAKFSTPTLIEVEEVLTSLVRRSKNHAAAWFQENGNDTAWAKQNWKNHITKWLSKREGVTWI